MNLQHCHNFHDFKRLAKRLLPAPIYHYIAGGADDEATLKRNSQAFDDCDLIPSVLTGVEDIDLSVEVMGQTLDVPFYCSPTALQRLFHYRGERAVAEWGGHFCLKGIMSVEDAKRAADIGCSGIVVSNHGRRQLDGSRSSFDHLAEIVDAVGDRLDVLFDSGIQRGTHAIKALSLGAKAVGIGRDYLFPLAAAGQPGVERALALMRAEIERDMRLMGKRSVAELSPQNLRYR